MEKTLEAPSRSMDFIFSSHDFFKLPEASHTSDCDFMDIETKSQLE